MGCAAGTVAHDEDTDRSPGAAPLPPPAEIFKAGPAHGILKHAPTSDCPARPHSNGPGSRARKSVIFEDDMETIQYANGDVYKGMVADSNIREGFGVLVWASGDRYEGDWLANEKHGHGVFAWVSGDHYEGDYVNGYRHGNGCYVYAHGFRYEGEWVADRRCGYGVLYEASGNRYEGEWKDDQRHGRGVFRWVTSGKVYDGEWVKDLKEGYGIQTYTKGTSSTGEPIVDKYIGEWKANKKNGQGQYIYASGAKFEGRYVEDRRVFGTFVFESGSRFEGEWQKDQASGFGVMKYAIPADAPPDTVAEYVGEWRSSKKWGKGKEILKDGSVWEGEFADNTRTSAPPSNPSPTSPNGDRSKPSSNLPPRALSAQTSELVQRPLPDDPGSTLCEEAPSQDLDPTSEPSVAATPFRPKHSELAREPMNVFGYPEGRSVVSISSPPPPSAELAISS
eukprot:NODE_1294_length_1486_cov_18.846207_g1075_i0.p1 GENE.NODE_1294_length_1486_cov_18.846207_g1075_i0~~NODE_1294_length_1486_cov_18.846207_g1075_i0.p1  ORF type:complete len:450 (+),score=25.17 NODE_1294_length_1486_cov_18.846207_g1075_i0:71-1420(+)